MKKLLIVVDYQKDFVDGALGFPGAEKLAEGIQSRIQSYRASGDEVVFTFDTHQMDYMNTQEALAMIQIAVIGHGTVGSGVVDLLHENASECEEYPRFLQEVLRFLQVPRKPDQQRAQSAHSQGCPDRPLRPLGNCSGRSA